MLLGSYQNYMQEFTREPGTYYLTKGWLEAGSDPLKEYHEVREKYGDQDAEWIMDTQRSGGLLRSLGYGLSGNPGI